jgi:hypothetical protein
VLFVHELGEFNKVIAVISFFIEIFIAFFEADIPLFFGSAISFDGRKGIDKMNKCAYPCDVRGSGGRCADIIEEGFYCHYRVYCFD